MSASLRYGLPLGLAGLTVLLDQITKLWALAVIDPFRPIEVVPGLVNLVLVFNRGAAFGFLNRADIRWQTTFFVCVASLAIVLVFHLLRTAERIDKVLFTGLGLILGGAVGNMIDRIRLGEVVDFVDVYLGEYHWPAFNVADVAISAGAGLLLLSFFLSHGSRQGPQPGQDGGL